MKKLLSILLTLCMCLSICAVFTACKKAPPTSASYQVTEAEWKMNFNLTKASPQAQTLSNNARQTIQLFAEEYSQLQKITSYTLYAEGVNGNTSGRSTLKVAPNAMSIEFYIGNTLREQESGIYEKTEVLYQTLTVNLMNYFPFENNYGDFQFDEEKKAYVSQNLTSIMVDDYDPSKTKEVHTKSAEVKFVNGYLKTINVALCDKNFENAFASFEFTFSNINNTTVNVQ